MSVYITTIDRRITPADCGADPTPDELRDDWLADYWRASDRERAVLYAEAPDAWREAIDRQRAADEAAVLGALDAVLAPAIGERVA